ncbi:hypothetical protein N7508_002462 [Penicillium antarcticum]|uniref:uncharacterized protein n=1 Tax=Penicillium antarcticum TaxID=416450 RepID=UPI00238DE9DA|nr:uncharacterized protein N7508_002462 [Penicillium antarcticum]KAJ5317954.1 hypothetical protein N7508_002462 [Penicillium antarcticum]
MSRLICSSHDWNLYILNYIDRQNLAAAKLQGIMEDLNMSIEQFATAVSILFIGSFPFQIPSDLIFTKISRPDIGSDLRLHQPAQQWSKHIVNSSQYEPSSETPMPCSSPVRSPISQPSTQKWNSASGSSVYTSLNKLVTPSSLFAEANDGVHNIWGWQWLFIIEDSVTVGIGIICACIMPECATLCCSSQFLPLSRAHRVCRV